MKNLSLDELQIYLKAKDFHPELKKDYFLKLAEEVGEIARAMRKNQVANSTLELKGSVQEEICDVLYYGICLANLYDMNLSEWFIAKERLNDEKYGNYWSEQLSPNYNFKIIKYTDDYRDDMLLCYLLAKEALGKTRLRDDLLDIKSNYFDLGDEFWLAISDDNRVVGMVGEHRISDKGIFLKRLFIKPDHKRCGIASQLLETIEKYARAHGISEIHTRFPEHYVEAGKFYPAKGFIKIGLDENQNHLVKKIEAEK